MAKMVLAAKPLTIEPSIWPLRASPNGRYVVSADGLPFFVFGDSVQTLMHSLSEVDSEEFFENRESHGINANWAHLYSNLGPDAGWGNAFTSGAGNGNDLSQPREAYFAHVDRVFNQAKAHGICLFVGVPGINGTYGSSSSIFFQNTEAKARDFGTYLGNRYRNQGNIVWVCGNDYSAWNTANDSKMRAFMDGVIAADTNNMLTAEIYPTPNLSWDAPNYRTRIDLNLSYTYAPPYTNTKRGYNQNSGLSLIQFEVLYDEASRNNNGGRHGYWGTPANLRRVLWWSILWGCNGGYFYGNSDTWTISGSEVSAAVLNTPGLAACKLAVDFFRTYPWYDLVPDFNHTLVTAGYGAFQVGAESGYDLGNATATTTASTPDGSLAIAYMERGRNTTVNMSRMAAPVVARWFNPRNATYTLIGQFDNSGSHVFVPPSTSDDWALVLRVQSP